MGVSVVEQGQLGVPWVIYGGYRWDIEAFWSWEISGSCRGKHSQTGAEYMTGNDVVRGTVGGLSLWIWSECRISCIMIVFRWLVVMVCRSGSLAEVFGDD